MKKILIFLLTLFLLSCSNKIYKNSDGNDGTVYRKMAKPIFTEEMEEREMLDYDSDGVPDYIDEEVLIAPPPPPPPPPSPPPPPPITSQPIPVNGIGTTIPTDGTIVNNESNFISIGGGSLPTPFETINDEINNTTTLGEISYVLNDTMIVDVITKVNMTISKNVTRETLISEIETFTENNLHSESIRISPVMRAKLTDPSGINFRIIPTSNEEQFIQDGDFTTWTWNVTPLIKGNNPLSLTVDIIIGDKNKTMTVFDGDIYVYSDKTITEKILDFLNENWKYFLSSLIIPFLVFLYKKRNDLRKK